MRGLNVHSANKRACSSMRSRSRRSRCRVAQSIGGCTDVCDEEKYRDWLRTTGEALAGLERVEDAGWWL
jgi:hypothetical protein